MSFGMAHSDIAADVASLGRYRLDLLPDPVVPLIDVRRTKDAELPPPAAPEPRPDPDPISAIAEVLARLADRGQELGAVEVLLADDARAAAEESARRMAAGTARPLEGLPFGVKDVIQVEGSPTTFGSRAYAGFHPATTAQVVGNLRAAGAILVAKLATYEFASGPNSHTHNPWNPSCRSGGSSSGPAAAVGAGILPLAIGSDSGGSIRVPASWCGAVGLKPTLGRVPRTGTPPLSWTLDHTGPITRTSALAAAVLGTLAGEPRASASAAGTSERPLEGLRIGVLGGWFRVADPEVLARVDDAVNVLAALGAHLVPIELPVLNEINPDAIKRVVVAAESGALHDPNRAGYGPAFTQILENGHSLRAGDYLHALRLGVVLAQAVTALFDSVDVLACATCPIAAPPEGQDAVLLGGIEQALSNVVARNTSVFNISGHPALTVPCGFTSRSGVPVGLQIVAPRWQDELCLRIGIAYEEAMGQAKTDV